ncbi:hypothetical protein I3843_13G011200 [Carya illinoinensis]|uniref:Glutaredoxin domain-containing protein n=1 Tax=Carya illinoinensis TaxID=32201 RepID=A0A8T1NJ53_CARIL|nr:uncharacterized protein At5g39865-like [Carya illinoinensis]KAG6630365.1 hypothetical protein CIPAW_13G012600 [Carya illinoinensis]KAG6679878.1 hypothetical protein I3842_13G012400 [Carya illinoinensis]KAG7948491.1 hypothetical protein I3843_13G011200 [Carya illinoinensis]
MAESENQEISGNSKSKFSSFFNHSLTLHHQSSIVPPKKPYLQAALDRTGSGSFLRFYNSFESVRSAGSSIKGKVKQLRSFFESSRNTKESVSQSNSELLPSKLKPATKSIISVPRSLSIRLLGTEDKIVVFFTSLRGVRRTYEDCYAVRMIFQGFRVWVDERDVSMDSAYLKEMQSVLGQKNVTLPQVFVRGKHLGGAEVIKHLFEVGELTRILQGFPVQKPEFVCESCGDVRFVPCSNCNGSRKVFDEDEDKVKRCLECNENGLVRCSDCCS